MSKCDGLDHDPCLLQEFADELAKEAANCSDEPFANVLRVLSKQLEISGELLHQISWHFSLDVGEEIPEKAIADLVPKLLLELESLRSLAKIFKERSDKRIACHRP